LGPTVQFLVTPEEGSEALCVLKTVIPAGGFVPLHSHEDVECFYLLSGIQEALIETRGNLVWTECRAGDYIYVPGGAKHAWRNQSGEPAVSICTTTARLGRFFDEVGGEIYQGEPLLPPSPERLQHFIDTAKRFGYWLGTPEENTAVGILLF